MSTLLIKNGHIYDGTGRPWYSADVLIRGDRIERIGKIGDQEADGVIDATGLAVAPGFWDLHTHDDFILGVKEHPGLIEPRIRSGITTIVGGNCGYSPHPVSDEYFEDLKGYAAFIDGGLSYEWRDLDGYLSYLENQGILLNFATAFGQGALRTAVMGIGNVQPANEEQLNRMKQLVRQEMEQGAFGMSTGLLYPPGQFTPTDELLELAKVVAEYGGLYLTHLRNESELAFEALGEAIAIGQGAGVRVQIHHHETFGEKYFWKMEPTLEMMREARELRDVDISFDFIPYTGDNSPILCLFPSWAFEGGIPKLIERIRDPEQLRKMREDAENYVPTWPPLDVFPHNVTKCSAVDSKNKWNNMFILWCRSEKNKELEGLTFAQLGEKKSKHPYDAAAELAAEEMGAVMTIEFGGTGQPEKEWQTGSGESRIDWQAPGKIAQVKHPFSTIQSDAILGKARQSPAAWGTAPRVLGRYAREMGLITMEEGVRKLTFNAAGVLRIDDRGMIRKGNFADITIFNPDTVVDRATWKEQKEPEGIEYVIINGTVVLEQGTYHRGRLAGQVMRSQTYY